MLSCNYLLLDDNPTDVLLLENMLHELPFISTIHRGYTIKEATDLINSHKYDIVFLNTHLADHSGLDWLQHLPIQPVSIVTSTEVQQAVEAYDLGVADFLLKPIALPRLMRAIIRALSINKKRESDQRILLYSGRKIHQFLFDDILFIEAFGVNTKIYTNTRITLVSSSISGIEAQLPRWQFLRVQKSFIVNLSKISILDAKSLWIGETKISIGLQYRELLRQLFSPFVRNDVSNG